MKKEILDKITFSKKTSIREVLKTFEKTASFTESKGFGIVKNEKNSCIAVVTDGDIRSYLVQKGNINHPVSKVMNTNFFYAHPKETSHQLIRYFDNGISNLPILDDKKKLLDLVGYSKIHLYLRNSPLIVRTRVPLRITYSGGGTDFSSYLKYSNTGVLTSSINKYATASVLIRSDEEINIFSRDLDINCNIKNINKIKYDGKLDLIKAAIKVCSPKFGFDLEINSDVKPGTGLGSSSAVTVAVIGALNYFNNEKSFDLYKVADLAYQAERIELKIQGGWQDQYATTFGGFNWIDFSSKEVVVSPLRLHKDILLELEYNLLLFNIGGSRDAQKTNSKKLKSIKKESKLIQKTSKEMFNTAIKMKKSLLKGNVKHFGDFLDVSWEIKKKLNASTSNKRIDKLYKTARDRGALGGKLLGAGQNGYMLIYASPLFQKEIIEKFQSKGCFLENFSFTSSGLSTWTVER